MVVAQSFPSSSTVVTPARNGPSSRVEELERRIEGMIRLQRAEAKDLLPIQKADFAKALAAAQAAVDADDDHAIAAAILALDVLSLELCEE